jgi:hypothetical protein
MPLLCGNTTSVDTNKSIQKANPTSVFGQHPSHLFSLLLHKYLIASSITDDTFNNLAYTYINSSGTSFARGDALVRHRNRGICDGSLVPRKK